MHVEVLTSGFYVNPGSMMEIGIIFPTLGILAVSARFYARLQNSLGLGVDDWLCIPALVFLSAVGAVYTYAGAEHIFGTRLPPGVSFSELLTDPSFDHVKYLKVEFYCNFFSNWSTGMIRLSFLFFYRRLFLGKTFNIISWALIGLVISWIIATAVANFLVGDNYILNVWKGTIGTIEQNYSVLRFIGGMSITGFILDLLILSVPFPWIWRLHMPRAQKFAVSSVFLCGVFIVIAGAIRMVNGIEAMKYRNGDYMDIFGLKAYGDLLGWPSVWLFWSYIENGTGMIVCCLPALKPLFSSKPARKVAERLPSWGSIRSMLSTKASNDSMDNFSGQHISEQEKGLSNIEVARTIHQYTVPRQSKTPTESGEASDHRERSGAIEGSPTPMHRSNQKHSSGYIDPNISPSL